MRIVFFGTPGFAAASLAAIAKSGIEIAAVVTTPDQPDKRHHSRVTVSAVKARAEELGLPLLQPKSLKSRLFLSRLEKLQADLFVVVAFRMLPKIVWDMPRKGSVNLHGSLLPSYRGAAPINWAIIQGEEQTGVTVFQLAAEIDTGRILKQSTMSIGNEETFGELYERMQETGANLLVETLHEIARNEVHFKAQDETLVSQAPKLNTENTKIDFNQPATSVRNLVRGLSPVPAAWMEFEGKKMKVFRCEVSKKALKPSEVHIDKSGLYIGTSTTAVALTDIQPEGKKRMNIKDWLNGRKIN